MTKQEQEYAIGEIEFYFGAGRVDRLRELRCPFCQETLLFSVYKEDNRSENGLIKCGISIYCAGSCGKMLSHMDGYCPHWAEAIHNWDEFSRAIYDGV